MKMHVLSGGRLRTRKSMYVPGAERTDLIDLPVIGVLLRHKQGNVLFDTGYHPKAALDAEAWWGGMAKAFWPVTPPEETLLRSLSTVGLKPEDIDLVVNSHLHTDHCGCNEFFTRATVICHADELAAASAETAAREGYLDKDWKHPMPIETFDTQRDLFGDGSIVLLGLPGHTRGTSAALVSLERSGKFLLASDVIALRFHLDQDLSPKNTWNPELAAKSRAEVRAIVAAGATLVCGHDAEQWDTLRTGAEFYD